MSCLINSWLRVSVCFGQSGQYPFAVLVAFHISDRLELIRTITMRLMIEAVKFERSFVLTFVGSFVRTFVFSLEVNTCLSSF